MEEKRLDEFYKNELNVGFSAEREHRLNVVFSEQLANISQKLASFVYNM